MGRKPAEIVVKQIVDLKDLIGDRHRISVSVGPNLEPIVLSLDCEPDYRRLKNGASFPKLETEQLNAFKIHFLEDGEWSELALTPTHENYHHVQPLKGGQWLLVRGRANGDNDCNAHIFSAAGRRIRSFAAGDGIEDVQADESGNIWISYFDEGVFGETTLGNSGLVCLDSSGKLVFDFQSIPHPCVQSMADCYALNVCSDEEVWVCYYTDFPDSFSPRCLSSSVPFEPNR